MKANLKKDIYYGYDEINEKLQLIETKIQDISLYFRANKLEPTKDLFIEKFDSNEKIETSNEFDFFKCFTEYIDKGKLTKTPNTIKGQSTIKNYLEFFCKENAIALTFDNIDDDFFELLRDYSYQTKKMKQNYFAKVIKVLKSFLNWATEKGYNTNRDFEIKLIRFDDNQGLHYDISLVDLEIEKILNNENDNFSIEKSLLILSSSIENLKLVFAENNLISSLSEKSDNILQTLSDIKVSLEKNLKNNKHLLKFAGDSKKIYPLFERYLDLKYKNDGRLKEFKIQFIKFVKFFTDEKVYEEPSINSFDAKDVKYLMGFFSYLNAKKIAEYKNFDLVLLILKITKQEIEIKNTSIEHALRNPAFKLSELEEKSINSVYNRLFKS